jgi:RimJ/RimL family protein N-acetyltransferase
VDRVRAALSGPLDERWGSFLVIDTASGEAVGSCMLDRVDGELDISYQLLPEHWGHGYAREAVVRVIEWAWNSTDDDHIVATTRSENAASVRLLEVVGMTKEREFVEHGASFTRFRLDRA